MPDAPRAATHRRAVSSFATLLFLIASNVLACAPENARARSIADDAPRKSESIGPTERAPTVSAAAASVGPIGSPKLSGSPNEAPSGRARLADARRHMLSLINRDRASEGLPAVTLDEGPASRSAQRHAEDMARRGFLGHWGTDGSVPEQRHTESGGADMVLENASCFTDEKLRELDRDPLIAIADVDRAEQMFFNEKPPADGHRRNILKRLHTRVGIGIAQFVATEREIPVSCITQEFVDGYGSYAPLPKSVARGRTIHVEGELRGFSPAGVGIARVDSPGKLSPADANKRRSYPVPQPKELYWRAGFKTSIVMRVDGQKFAIDVPAPDSAGLYEISVWASPLRAGVGNASEGGEMTMVGLRTIVVE